MKAEEIIQQLRSTVAVYEGAAKLRTLPVLELCDAYEALRTENVGLWKRLADKVSDANLSLLNRAEKAEAENERLARDAARVDFVERHLCRAAEVMQNGQCVKLARCWQIVGELETFRDTVDAMQAAMQKDQPQPDGAKGE